MILLAVAMLAANTAACQTTTEPPPRAYPYRMVVAVNQLLNTILGGDPDETLSSRWGRAKRRGSKPARAACWLLARADPCHCEASVEFDDAGRPLPHQLWPKDR